MVARVLATRSRHLTSFRQFRRRWYLRIPVWIRRRDFELFTALLCITAGLPLLLTQNVEAASLEAALPPWVVFGWSLILTLAPICVIVGLWQAHRHAMYKATVWLRLEALGLKALAYAAYLYVFIILLATGGTAVPAAALISAFALTCHSRSVAVTLKVEDYLLGIGAG